MDDCEILILIHSQEGIGLNIDMCKVERGNGAFCGSSSFHFPPFKICEKGKVGVKRKGAIFGGEKYRLHLQELKIQEYHRSCIHLQ